MKGVTRLDAEDDQRRELRRERLRMELASACSASHPALHSRARYEGLHLEWTYPQHSPAVQALFNKGFVCMPDRRLAGRGGGADADVFGCRDSCKKDCTLPGARIVPADSSAEFLAVLAVSCEYGAKDSRHGLAAQQQQDMNAVYAQLSVRDRRRTMGILDEYIARHDNVYTMADLEQNVER